MRAKRNRRNPHDAAWHAAQMGEGPPGVTVSGQPISWRQLSTLSKYNLVRNPELGNAPDHASLFVEFLNEARSHGWKARA